MFKIKLSAIVPAQLIVKPLEQAIIVLCLIAMAQFFNYSLVNSQSVSLQWLLSAPALMFAVIIIALRIQRAVLFLPVFFIGLSAVLVYTDAALPGVLFTHNHLQQNLSQPISFYLMTAALFSLIFSLLMSYLFNSALFSALIRQVNLSFNHHLLMAFKRICFYLSFATINLSVLIGVFMISRIPDGFSLIVLLSAILSLFILDIPVLEKLRGVLLPVYMTLFLVFIVQMKSAMRIDQVENYEQILLFWAFFLWFFHNVLVSTYNTIFSSKKLMTGSWPWYGLFIILLLILNKTSVAVHISSSLLIIISYLFLLLRNTTFIGFSRLIVFLVLGLFVSLMFAEQSMNMLLPAFWDSAQGLLVFTLFLLLASSLWDRYLNALFISMGWPSVSFRQPIILSCMLIASLFLMFNLLAAISIVSDNFNLLNTYIISSGSPYLVLIVFMAIALFDNNKIIANFLHLSAIVLLLIICSTTKVVPVYLFFALIYLVWSCLPVFIERINFSRIDLQTIISESTQWLVVSFILSAVFMSNAISGHDIDYGSIDLVASFTAFLIGSVIRRRYYSEQKGQKNRPHIFCIVGYFCAAGIIVSLRLLFMGTVALNEFDSIGLFIIAFSFYFINQAYAPSLIYSDTLAKLLPLSVLLTIPWSVGSLHSSLTLFVLGIFYFIIQGRSRLLQYTAFTWLSIAVYIWMPILSEHTGLLLFYVIPVVFSLLFITHLHKNEMKKRLRNNIQLFATGLIYVVVSADIFLNESIGVFALGLLLGLAGVIYAISSKTRVFLYTGVSFISVIILGQLMLFYPEGRLARALILMCLGAAVTGAMIWFNIKREYLSAQIKLLRADLGDWN